MREKDYLDGYKRLALKTGYTSVSFKPISMEEVGKEIIVLILKDELVNVEPYVDDKEFKRKVFNLHKIDNLEFRKYISYLLKKTVLYKNDYFKQDWIIENDNVYVRYRKNTKYSKLGIVTLEREYEI
jgi:hypothetical protein